jgi:phosphatidylglycerophosphate synthase
MITRDYLDKRKLPNVLSISRIPIALSIAAIYDPNNIDAYITALFLILLASITDILDGYIARKYNCESESGYLLDGLGDKAIHLSLTLTIFLFHHLNIILLWIIIFRDILTYAAKVLVSDWPQTKTGGRLVDLTYAITFRLWIFTYLFQDGLSLYGNNYLDSSSLIFRSLFLVSSVFFGYYIVFRTLNKYLGMASQAG